MTLPKIYVYCSSNNCHGQGDEHLIFAIAEDGACLASHVCSNHQWAVHDMGINQNGWKRDIYAAHYPDGFDVVWVEEPEKDENFRAAFEKNQSLPQSIHQKKG